MALTALLLPACTSDAPGDPTEATDRPPTTAATTAVSPTAASAACGPEQHPQLQEGSHLIGDATPPVPYSSSPPTSGWHASGPARLGVIPPEDPLRDPEIVNALEDGHVVAAYDLASLPEADVVALADLATGAAEDRLTVTPYDGEMDGAILTLLGWGVLQRCDTLDAEAVRSFVDRHADSDGADHA